MSNTISVADLARLGACEDQVFMFSLIFPEADNGVEVTVENVLRASKAGLDLHWLARALFTTPAYVEYKRGLDATWEKYLSVERPAWVEYERLLTRIPKASKWAIGVGKVAYNRIENAAGEKYYLAEATAWVAAYEASAEVAGKGAE